MEIVIRVHRSSSSCKICITRHRLRLIRCPIFIHSKMQMRTGRKCSSIAYQTYDVLQAMQNDSDIEISELRVDGGASVNNKLMQFQSDLLQTMVVRPHYTETTALGAAYFAGLAINYWESIDEIKQHWHTGRIFSPELNPEKTAALIKGWKRAIKTSHAWTEDSE